MNSSRLKNLWIFVGWMLIGLVIYLSLTPSPPKGPEIAGIDRLSHFTAYFLLTLWFAQIFSKRVLFFVYGTGFVLMGVLLEFAQWALPFNRSIDLYDMLANTIGVCIASLLARTRLGNLFEELK